MLARPGPCKKYIARILDMLTDHGSPILSSVGPVQGLSGKPVLEIGFVEMMKKISSEHCFLEPISQLA